MNLRRPGGYDPIRDRNHVVSIEGPFKRAIGRCEYGGKSRCPNPAFWRQHAETGLDRGDGKGKWKVARLVCTKHSSSKSWIT